MSCQYRPAKCKLLKDKLTFLGHQISAQGVTKDPEKVSLKFAKITFFCSADKIIFILESSCNIESKTVI